MHMDKSRSLLNTLSAKQRFTSSPFSPFSPGGAQEGKELNLFQAAWGFSYCEWTEAALKECASLSLYFINMRKMSES